MREFSFLTITFNHSKYIVEHLESIKEIVLTFGQNVMVDFIVADDCSSDNTVMIINEWLKDNKALFRNITIIDRKENVGTVRNICDAVSYVNTEDFKLLAGDDRYTNFNIFDLYDGMDGKVVISPIKIFGENREKEYQIVVNQQVLINCYERGKMKQLLKVDNFIASPGMFIPGRYLRDKELWQSLYEFKIIEDYPMVRYLMDVVHVEFVFVNRKYIEYRVDAGVSNCTNHSAKSAYLEEVEKLHSKYHMKAYVCPKFINPCRYWLKYQREVAKRQIKRKKDDA